jgi:hypothetical protein
MPEANQLSQALFVFDMTDFHHGFFTHLSIKHASPCYEHPSRSSEDRRQVFERGEHVLVPDEHSDDGPSRPVYKDFGVNQNSMFEQVTLS